MPSAKIVGNITDMKKKVPNNAYKPSVPPLMHTRGQRHVDDRIGRQHEVGS